MVLLMVVVVVCRGSKDRGEINQSAFTLIENDERKEKHKEKNLRRGGREEKFTHGRRERRESDGCVT